MSKFPDREARARFDGCRYRGQTKGHYESYFQRANHPERALAFWNRYTIFSPKNHPEKALGELWAIYFDGENKKLHAAKEVFELDKCYFSRHRMEACVGRALLNDSTLSGRVASSKSRLEWDLSYSCDESPLFMLPESLYDSPLPKAKALVGSPNARYRGHLKADDERVEISDWIGSQNHNWGSKHTDQYAWGQIAGFDGHPESFLEIITARIKLGPIYSPWLTLMVLRLEGQDFSFHSLRQGLRARGSYHDFRWSFDTCTEERASLARFRPRPGPSSVCPTRTLLAEPRPVSTPSSRAVTSPSIVQASPP